MQKSRLVLIFFGLFWSALVLLFDGILGYGIANQLRACRFPTATGVITHSEIAIHHDSDGNTTGVDIRYHYQVEGRDFDGTRYRYGAGSSSDSKWAEDAVHHYSVGSEVPVFYDPKNPSESVLSPGLDGSNYMFLLFMTPFNMVMLGFWCAGVGILRNTFFRSPNGGVKTIRDGHSLRIRLPRYPGWMLGVATTGPIAFIEIFVVLFGGGGFHPKIGFAATALAIAYGAGLVVMTRQWLKTRSGVYDLAIDERDGSFELPLTFGRKTRIPISAADVSGVVVDTALQKNSSATYVPTIVLCDQKPSDGKLAEWVDETRAENFAAWLRAQLKVAESNKKSSAWKSSMPVPDRPTDIS